MNNLNERTMTARERYELNHPLIETIGKIEIRKNVKDFSFTANLGVGLWSCHVKELAEAREIAVKANNLMDAGFMLYGFHGVCIFEYDKLVKFAESAHPSQMQKYWLYI